MLTLYQRLIRLLPDTFRREWMGEAEEDVRRAMADAVEERGPWGGFGVGFRACCDVARALPVEWWRVARAARVRRRDDGRMEMMRTWIADLRIAARTLARRPGFATVAALTLALGIGANVAIFSVVDAVLLRPLDYDESDRLVAVDHHAPALGLPVLNHSPGTLAFYDEHGDFLEAVAGYDVGGRNVVLGEDPERFDVLHAAPALFDVLRVSPVVGRRLVPGDAAPGAPSVALLSHDLWTGRFEGDPGVVGSTLRIDGVVTEIVGVLPDGFAFPDPDPVLMTALEVDPARTFGAFGTSAVGRLAEGLDLEDARRRANELQALLPDFFGGEPDAAFLEGAGWSVSVERMRDRMVGDDVSSTLWVMLGTVGLVLLIACANVANLFLVRAESRRTEVAVRAALGASRGRVASLFLSEAGLLGVVGGAVGLVLGGLGMRLLVTKAPLELPRLHEVGVDARTVAFTVTLSVLAALLVGSLPLLRLGGRRFARILRDGGRGSTIGRERHRARNVLVAGQLALAVVLLVGSGLMARSFAALRSVDPGIDPTNLLVVGVSLGDGVEEREGASFYQRVADDVAALPGAASVGIGSMVPLAGGSVSGGSFYLESRPREEGALPDVAMYKAVGADYLGALRQRLVEGRALERGDWEGDVPVALVNQAFADRFLDGEAVGDGVKWDENRPFARIVGVVSDVREYNLRDEPEPWVYLPLVVGDWGYPSMAHAYLVVRTAPGTDVPGEAIRAIVARHDASVPLTSVRTMDEVMAGEVAGTSFTLVLLGVAAGMALFLGAIGLFGVISYVVGQRTREIGVRVALGARTRDIERMVLAQAAVVVAVGVGVGLVGAAGLTRLMGTLLYGISAMDPLAFLLAPLVLGAVAMSAALAPARKASRVEPSVALRSE